MYKITSDGYTAYADTVNLIRALENGNYTPTDAQSADGFCAKLAVKDEDGNVVLTDRVFALPERTLTGTEPEGQYEEVSAALLMLEAEDAETAAKILLGEAD